MRRSKRVTLGTDGMLPKHLNYKHVEVMWRQLEDGTYRLKPIRIIYKKKKSGTTRRIGVYTMIDQTYLATLNEALNRVLTQFNEIPPSVHSFVSNRGVDSLMQYIRETSMTSRSVLLVDVVNAYDNVNLTLLYYICGQIGLSNQMLDSIMLATEGQKGLVQGSPLSPTLFNIYLNDIDKIYGQLKTRLSFPRYARYADNLWFGVNDTDTAESAAIKFKRDFKTLGMEITTKVIPPDTDYEFLGVTKRTAS